MNTPSTPERIFSNTASAIESPATAAVEGLMAVKRANHKMAYRKASKLMVNMGKKVSPMDISRRTKRRRVTNHGRPTVLNVDDIDYMKIYVKQMHQDGMSPDYQEIAGAVRFKFFFFCDGCARTNLVISDHLNRSTSREVARTSCRTNQVFSQNSTCP